MGFPYYVKYLAIIFIIYQREKVQYLSNKNGITLVKAKKGQKVNWAQIRFNSLCSELDMRYKYVKDNKGDKKDTYQFALVLAKFFQYLFMHQKDNPQKPLAKVERTKEEMEITLENKKKLATHFPISALERKNKVEEGGASSSGMKRE